MRKQYLLSLLIPLTCSSMIFGQDLVKQHQKLMCEAISSRNIERLKKLIATPYVDVHDATPCGGNYLLAAVNTYDPNVVRVLLDAGVDPFYIVPPTGSSLTGAAHGNNPEVLSVLLQAMANYRSTAEISQFINTKSDITGETAIYAAVMGSVAKEEEPSLGMAKILIEAGADPNNGPGQHMLLADLRAVHPTYTRLIQYLVQHGAR